MKVINLNLRENSYKIYIAKNLLHRKFKELKNLGNFAIVISNKKILQFHQKRIEKFLYHANVAYQILTVPQGEKAKSFYYTLKLLKKLINLDKLERKLFIICIGGGVIGDLGGFIASIYKRGISYIQVPTTLLACVDASIGGKTAIDLKEAKNVVGTFYQPKAVLIDLSFLSTIGKKEIKEGCAEIIKYAIIKDKNFFNFLEKNYLNIQNLKLETIKETIENCIRIKSQIVEKDEKEKKGIRTLLNFGHTIAHALETSLEYSQKITHGKAVALGMIGESYLSHLLGFCSMKEVERIINLIHLYQLPTKIHLVPSRFMKALKQDKKFMKGYTRIVLIRNIGKAFVKEKIPLKLIMKALSVIKR